MAQGDHIHPIGAALKYGIGAAVGNASINLGELLDIEPPSVKRGKSNDTTLAAVNGVGTNSAGWGDPSEFKATIYLVGAQFALLKTIESARTTAQWAAVLSKSPNQSTGGDTIGFAGWIVELKITKAEQMSEDKIKCEITGQMTGDIGYLPGS